MNMAKRFQNLKFKVRLCSQSIEKEIDRLLSRDSNQLYLKILNNDFLEHTISGTNHIFFI